LGEIESALGEHKSVKQSVVVAGEDERGAQRLIGYVVGEAGVTAAGLKAYLREKLPEYMIPEAILMLDELPLTPNGKVDRRSLPAPEGNREEGNYEAARTPVEEKLCGLWSEALRLERVGVRDNFFDLGGHSLLGTRLISQVREVFQLDLPLRTLFERPTVAEFAQVIEQSQDGQQHPYIPEIHSLPRGNKSLDDLLADIEWLSEAEIQAMLNSEISTSRES
jgi:hypothetical protein